MSNKIKLTENQKRIKQLENELLEMRNLFMLKIERIQSIVGIDDAYVHEPVEPLSLE